MFNSTSHSFVALTRELSISTLEENFHIYARPCIILYISDLLLIYYKNGPLILLWGENPSNNYFETKFKSRDTTQSPPEKKKNRYLVYWYSGTSSFKMTGQGSWNKPTSSKSSEKSHFRPHDFMYIPNWQLKEFLRKFAWRLELLYRIIMA